ncbi:hypothetical protein [Chthonobacter rhizosphaerae]|uniref:hypothetical protein n=1 Tax=Chthonobacter rhizosphaerae TaxID=2735553 RepID=UPI0015EEF640|nr:hypothetical protein [Chthonobacter rhizosphaerae]
MTRLLALLLGVVLASGAAAAPEWLIAPPGAPEAPRAGPRLPGGAGVPGTAPDPARVFAVRPGPVIADRLWPPGDVTAWPWEADPTATGAIWGFFAERPPLPEDPTFPFPQPFELVRALLQQQERIGLGDVKAYQTLSDTLERTAGQIAAMPPEVWAVRRNGRALAVFVAIGGDPSTAERLLADGTDLGLPADLLEGLVAYGRGEMDAATRLLRSIDPGALQPILGGHVALVRAALATRVKSDDAAALFDIARELLPGTLVEEAALRHGAVHAGRSGDFQRFRRLSGLYVRRFHRSVFFGDMQQQAAMVMLQLTTARAKGRFDEIRTLIDEFEPTYRRDIYLLLARRGLIGGDPEIAVVAGEVATPLAADDDVSRARADLYLGTAEMLNGRVHSARRRLDAIREEALPDRDRPMLAASRSFARRLLTQADVGSDDDQALIDETKRRASLPDPFASVVSAQADQVAAAALDVLKEASHVP